MPAFKNATEKRAWLLAQLEDVEREALLEEMTAGRNERITIRAGESFRMEVGKTLLYEGTDGGEFGRVLGSVIQALPLGSVFMVEAGRGGKVLSGGSAEDEAPAPLEVKPARARTARAKQAAANGAKS
jgi:hypothetical protein